MQYVNVNINAELVNCKIFTFTFKSNHEKSLNQKTGANNINIHYMAKSFRTDKNVTCMMLVCLLLLSLSQFFWESYPLGFDMLPQELTSIILEESLLGSRSWTLWSRSQSIFQLIPKMFDKINIGTLGRAMQFFNSRVIKSCYFVSLALAANQNAPCTGQGSSSYLSRVPRLMNSTCHKFPHHHPQ